MADGENPQTKRAAIRTWALVAVAVTSAFLMVMGWKMVDIFQSSEWCTQALGASKYAGGRPEFAVQACVGLMTIQLKAMSVPFVLLIGTLDLCLLALVVIVLTGGRIHFSASKTGLSADIGKGPTGRPNDPVHVTEDK